MVQTKMKKDAENVGRRSKRANNREEWASNIKEVRVLRWLRNQGVHKVKYIHITCEVLTPLTMKGTVFLGVTPCNQ
jgi:hypothetical protein